MFVFMWTHNGCILIYIFLIIVFVTFGDLNKADNNLEIAIIIPELELNLNTYCEIRFLNEIFLVS